MFNDTEHEENEVLLNWCKTTTTTQFLIKLWINGFYKWKLLGLPNKRITTKENN